MIALQVKRFTVSVRAARVTLRTLPNSVVTTANCVCVQSAEVLANSCADAPARAMLACNGMEGLGRRGFVLLALALAALLVGPGCLSSPTLPLPPPSPDDPTAPVDGQTRISGTVPGNDIGVRVLALNSRSNLIYGESTVANRFSFLADAQSGDVFVIWYSVGDEMSEPVSVTVPFAQDPPAAAATPLDAGADAQGAP